MTVLAGQRVTADGLNADDTGWVTTGFTAGSNFSIASCRYRVKNGVAYVEVALNRITSTLSIAASGNIVGDPVMVTIPAAARPSSDQYALWENSGVASGAARVETDGEVRLLDGTPSHTFAVSSIVYVTGSWIVD